MSRIRLPSFSNSAFSSINTYYKCDSTKEGFVCMYEPFGSWYVVMSHLFCLAFVFISFLLSSRQCSLNLFNLATEFSRQRSLNL